MKKIYFIVFFILIDFIFSQLFLLSFLEKDLIKANKESYENRIFNKDYNYTFKKLVKFKSHYDGNIYNIATNDLGFRDSQKIPINRKKTFSIVIGDSFIEGVGLEYSDTIVGMLNEKLEDNKFKFLNAGVASYSSYIYLKKIQNIINSNSDLKIKDVIVFLDKSDVYDDENFINRPEIFQNSKGKFINQRKDDFYKDLKSLSLWRFYTKQTISGKIIKMTTDQLENFASNLSKRYSISKKLNKSFFKVSNLEIQAIKSINNKPFVRDWYEDSLWNKKTKKNINFSIENLSILKKFLENKNINLIVVLYPWSFEIDNKKIRDRYLNFILPLLKNNKIQTIIIYDEFLSDNIYESIGKNFLYNDIHYNAEGNKIIVNSLIKKLKK